jgi:2-hydroxycyclohexanecarboxyl-CoA dehydrogenase
MSQQLEGRTAIVTGAGQGIGRGIALVLASRGARVVVSGRSPAPLDSLVDEITAGGGAATAVAGDVGSRADVGRTVETAMTSYGRVDILINNAQTSNVGLSAAEVTDEEFEPIFRSGAMGTLYAMQACFPHMVSAGGGAIVNFGSSTAITGDAGFTPYVMTKEAIRGLTRVAANEWGRHNIRVNVICPAAMSPAAEAYAQADPARFEKILRSIPLGRMGDAADDIGRAVAALVSDDMQFLTGATLLLDGGRLLVA